MTYSREAVINLKKEYEVYNDPTLWGGSFMPIKAVEVLCNLCDTILGLYDELEKKE